MVIKLAPAKPRLLYPLLIFLVIVILLQLVLLLMIGGVVKTIIYGRELMVLIIPALRAGEYQRKQNGLLNMEAGLQQTITVPMAVLLN